AGRVGAAAAAAGARVLVGRRCIIAALAALFAGLAAVAARLADHDHRAGRAAMAEVIDRLERERLRPVALQAHALEPIGRHLVDRLAAERVEPRLAIDQQAQLSNADAGILSLADHLDLDRRAGQLAAVGRLDQAHHRRLAVLDLGPRRSAVLRGWG